MAVISLYCGAGGIDEGLKQAGIKTTLAIDNCEKFPKKDPLETMKLNHPDCELICGNVGDYIESLPKAEIVVGGPPCPEFSRAKQNHSYDVCEVNNFWRAVEYCQPTYFLMENVPDINKVVKRSSYAINCADYGVPQTRIRRFFSNIDMPKPTHAKTPSADLFGNEIKRWVSVREALGLNGHMWFISSTGHRKQNRDIISRHIEEPSDTIVCAGDVLITNYLVRSEKKIKYRYQKEGYERKLTNEELAILQGFPKDYKFFGNKSNVKRQIGNAVPPPVIKAIFSQIMVTA